MVARERFLILHAKDEAGQLRPILGTADETVINSFIRTLVRLATRGMLVIAPGGEESGAAGGDNATEP